MKFYYKVFLVENGVKTLSFDNYLIAPIFVDQKVDETVGGGEIVLEMLPQQLPFRPKTKFIIERYADSSFTTLLKDWHFVVEKDEVESYVGVSGKFTHRVSLSDPCVVTQNMHCDNFALTYELQDCDMNYRTTRTETTPITNSYVISGTYDGSATHKKNLTSGYDAPLTGGGGTLGSNSVTGELLNKYKYVWKTNQSGGVDELKLNISGDTSHHISFRVPTLWCYGATNSGWQELFQMNTYTYVEEIHRKNGAVVGTRTVASLYSGATSLADQNNDYCQVSGGKARLRAVQTWDWRDESGPISSMDSIFTTMPNIIAEAKLSNANNQIEFDTLALGVSAVVNGETVEYKIISTPDSTYQSGMYSGYSADYVYRETMDMVGLMTIYHKRSYCHDYKTVIQASSISIEATFTCTDLGQNVEGGPFLVKGVKYSAYDLLRKALLTCDTHIIDNATTSLDEVDNLSQAQLSLSYPIIVDERIIDPEIDWVARLKTAKIYETVFEQKNLWEVLLQIGYYLHAIPYLRFSMDGTDRFILSFKQLGKTKEATRKNDDSSKLTIFSSQNLSEYFAQVDSYVTNMFSPKNLVDEWVVPKSNDSSMLVSNDTAELQLSYPITEIDKIEMSIGDGQLHDITAYVFEKSIYDILTSENPDQVIPAKGAALYYTLGDNKIQGLTYVPASVDPGDARTALKTILSKLGYNYDIFHNAKFNELKFHIRYRTQDSLRVTCFRPDIADYMKNSALEKYPHHEQFFGQQDKIIDSERFTANQWGRLIRSGNEIYQRQEIVVDGDEKEAGDLFEINGEAYYVTSVENEFYPEMTCQKVTYSKNFNQISQVVTIPSEPRFYEVSERSKIRREVRIQDFFALTTAVPAEASDPHYLSPTNWKDFMAQLLFNKTEPILPNYAWTRFMADRKRTHRTDWNKLFPSSEIDRTDPNAIRPVSASDHTDVIVPLLHFPVHSGIVFEWDMEDNFKAGDFIDTNVSRDNGAYIAQQAMRYCDVLGRADLMRFKLFYKQSWTHTQAQQLPKAIITPTNAESVAAVQGNETTAIALDKDNREALSFNYQINLLHRPSESNGEDFITFPNLFGPKDSELYCALIDSTVSMFDENFSISAATKIADKVAYTFNNDNSYIQIDFDRTLDIDLSKVKAIVMYTEVPEGERRGDRVTYIAKNVSKTADEHKLDSWYISSVFPMVPD